jgi:aspartate-semialdehyde dehydrogenase
MFCYKSLPFFSKINEKLLMTNTNKNITCAVLGATGMVGRRILEDLSKNPWITVKIVAASPKSAGKSLFSVISSKTQNPYCCDGFSSDVAQLIVKDVNDVKEIASQVDFVFSALDIPDEKIIALEEAYAKQEIMVVSNNSACRWIDDVPLIVPEINEHHLAILKAQRKRLGIKKGGIVAKPNCSLQSYIVQLHALRKLNPHNIVVSLSQAISGSGKLLKDVPKIQANMLPLPGEAEKSQKEPQKIFGKIVGDKIVADEKLHINAVSYRVAVEHGHTANVFFKLRQVHKTKELLEIFGKFNPLKEYNLPSSPYPVLNYLGDDTYPTPKGDILNQNGMEFTYGGLLFDQESYMYQFTGFTDNLGRGAGGGAILTAELLIALEIIQSKSK